MPKYDNRLKLTLSGHSGLGCSVFILTGVSYYGEGRVDVYSIQGCFDHLIELWLAGGHANHDTILIIWSDRVSRPGAQGLADAIKSAELGVVTETSVTRNYMHTEEGHGGNKVYVWSVDMKATAAYAEGKINRLKKAKNALKKSVGFAW